MLAGCSWPDVGVNQTSEQLWLELAVASMTKFNSCKFKHTDVVDRLLRRGDGPAPLKVDDFHFMCGQPLNLLCNK